MNLYPVTYPVVEQIKYEYILCLLVMNHTADENDNVQPC